MKPLLAVLTYIILSGGTIHAQSKESLYALDSSWNPTIIDSAHFLLRVYPKTDTCWQFDFYHFTGPLIKTEQYRDKEGEVLHGATRYYTKSGLLDSTGSYKNGKKHGDFYKLKQGSDTLRFQTHYIYQDNRLAETIDMQKNADTTRYPDEKESEYPGGASRWRYFLTKNLIYPERAIDNNIEGTVRVLFIVDATGQVHDPYISKSVEYSLDKEAIRMIQVSGKWTPGFQNGRNVKTYKLQPITYRLE